MAVYTSTNTFSPEDVKYVNTLDIPNLDLRQIERATEFDMKLMERDVKRAEDNFKSIQDTYDTLLGLRYDNQEQAAAYERLKQRHGLTNDTFATLDVNSLKSPFEARGIGGRLKKLTADPEFVEVQRQIFEADKFRQSAPTIEDPELRLRAMDRYDQYKKGKVSSSALNVNDFKPIDLEKEMVEAMKLIPQVESAEWTTNEDGTMAGILEKKQRAAEALNDIVARTVQNNPRFAENMKARGWMDEEGNVTDAFLKVRDSLVSEWAKESTQITNVKDISTNPKAKHEPEEGSRFGVGSETERVANAIDKDLVEQGFVLPDRSTVLDAANSNGIIELDANGNGFLVTRDKDGLELRRVPLKRMTKKQREASKYAMPIDITGDAVKDVGTIIAGSEADSRGYKSIGQPSTKSVALGKYQFVYSYFKDEIRKALAQATITQDQIDSVDIDTLPKGLNNKYGTMKEEDLRIAAKFLESPEAQEILWANHFDNLYKQASDLATRLPKQESYKSSGGRPYSLVELMYAIHHHGSADAAYTFITTGESPESLRSKNKYAATELQSGLAKIRKKLDASNLSGEISEPEGRLMLAFAEAEDAAQPTDTSKTTTSDSTNSAATKKVPDSVFGVDTN